MKKLKRFFAVAGATVFSALAALAMTACDTKYPEITITYEFNGNRYEVEYTLSREGAPQTVQHFIELADAGYYDGTVIHDYKNSGYLFGGGYTLGDHGELVEKDYFSEVKKLEQEKGITFTQSVFEDSESKTPLYTVRGEFDKNGVKKNSKSLYQNRSGTLVMYYRDKGEDDSRVCTLRTDDGTYQDGDPYRYNSATSLFYTTLSGASLYSDTEYCAFGRTSDYTQMQALIDAITEYEASRDENDPLFSEEDVILNQYDPFETVRSAKIPATYNLSDVPITIVSVKVDKY